MNISGIFALRQELNGTGAVSAESGQQGKGILPGKPVLQGQTAANFRTIGKQIVKKPDDGRAAQRWIAGHERQ